MLAHLPLGAEPLSTLAGTAAPTDDTIVLAALDHDTAPFQLFALEGADTDVTCSSPLADLPIVAADDTFVQWQLELELPDAVDEAIAALEVWAASPLEDTAEAPPPPPPQPGPLSALGGAGWFADVPPSRRKKPKPTWPNLPPPSLHAPVSWRLTTVTRDTARLRAHRAVKALRAKLKRDTNLEDHVIAGILAALIAEHDKDD
ncbi:MAG: hypothetical protein GC190_21090 [Alphaproteobacteria bacterium]|nr:hypothetical protein [Alphaproteobacteria bacterium]